ncbi:4'-phosphopantetheinyl transferase family protein [Nitratidesulfovibrio sp. 1201_IL3209]|jgi:4'-phosphopantetheinyl transferase|uniref:4'-phosphopantetheinyl transferase family protein n=1 Tax=Nitratidesulfovibrio sp. 1201_IL3209 TaxID=3084053 RepID=UPI002FD9F03B
MTAPRAFSRCRLPQVDDAALVCVGVRMDGDATEWIAAAAPFTTERERAHAGRFVHAVDAARHLVGRAIVRRTLMADRRTLMADRRALAVDGDFPRTRWGKPVCPPRHAEDGRDADGVPAVIDFSISHAGAMVWAAFCRAGCVGIDVEETRVLPDRPDWPDRPDLAGLAELTELAAQLHPCERDAIRALPATERAAAFYRCWTRKEAVLKALGRGLSLPLHGFQVHTGAMGADWLVSLPCEDAQAGDDAAPAPAQRRAEQECAPAWTTRDIDAGPGYQCSVAARAAHLPVAAHLVEDDAA